MEAMAGSSNGEGHLQVFDRRSSSLTSLHFSHTASLITSLKIAASEKENLCLYGYPNEQWEVTLPAEEVPPELPEPALGINFARDGMEENDWLALVAVHSDAWFLSVAFYFGARFGFDKADRLSSRMGYKMSSFSVQC